MPEGWITVGDSAGLAAGELRPLAPGAASGPDADWVIWRGRTGRLGAVPRRCPHLDADLADGLVVGDDLVCRSHGWCIDPAGRVGKRTERGRLDDKGAVPARAVRERDGRIEIDAGG